jgi:beta-glucosidase
MKILQEIDCYFSRSVGQVPIYYSQKNTGRPLNEEGKFENSSPIILMKEMNHYFFGFGLVILHLTIQI